MKKLIAGIFSLISAVSFGQCEINTGSSAMTITCGESVDLTAFGSSTGQVVLDEDFNGSSFGSGWSGSPGATSFSNPCSPGGTDGTPHAWMDNNTSVPRTLISQNYDLTSATAGVSICFDLLFAEQGDAAPCEGPDEPDEGVFLQYSTDGGATWIDIHYFDPNGGNDPQLTNWNNWCFEIPPAAITGNTMFRWHQSADSGADYDHWGIDNVQIFQNDINAEVVWNHDGYSYGVGSPGGVNPNPVTPTSTTTYTATITTGTGDVCTSDITITVIPPTYDVNVIASPTTVCSGDCSDITGTAQIVIDPGGIETYENAETGVIVGTPGITIPFFGTTPGDIDATMNINITGLNETFVQSGQILSVCITDLSVNPGFGCTSTNLGDVAIVLLCPDGTEVILADLGELSGNQMTNMCFSTGGAAISSGSAPYSGSFSPNQPLSNINGCTSNGVWTVDIRGENMETCLPIGSIGGWSITFDDPAIYQPVNATWSPTTGLSSPNTIATEACPTNTTDYVLTLDNGTPGCPVHEETVTITVDPCGGCIPPSFTVTQPATMCVPFTYDIANAVSGTGGNTVTYHNTNADANAGVDPMGSTSISTATSYFVRVEDPTDPTCFSVQEIIVNGAPLDDPSFTVTDFCLGSANQATSIATTGGTFSFNPVPTDGATIDPATGEVINGVNGTSYTVLYETNGICPSQTTENVSISTADDASFTLTDYCVGTSNSATITGTIGGTFTFNPAVTDGATIDAATGEITNGVLSTTYDVEYTTSGTCSASSIESVTVNSADDASFTVTDYCVGDMNSATNIATAGGTFAFNPTVSDGATIDASTGGITNGVGGTTYTIEYLTAGACSSLSTENVTVNLISDASFTLTDFCEGDVNSATIIGATGGTFTFNPTVSDGATIDALTGEVTNGTIGTTYIVEYTVGGACPSSTTQTVDVIDCAVPCGFVWDVTSAQTPNTDCTNTACDGTASVTPNNGQAPYTYLWDVNAGSQTTSVATGLCAGNYCVTITDDDGCQENVCIDVLENFTVEDPSFSLADFCEGAVNGPVSISEPGGIFTFNPAVSDGATIDAVTGEIINGIGGTTYSVQYETGGPCPETSIENVTVISQDDATFTLTNFCEGDVNSATIIGTTGGVFTFNPSVMDGAVVDGATGEITNGVLGTTYNIEYTTNGTCVDAQIESVTVIDCSVCTPPTINVNDISFCISSDIDIATAIDIVNSDVANVSFYDNSADANAGINSIQTVTSIAGVYFIRAEDLNDPTCFSVVQINVNELPLPIVDAGSDENICNGSSVTLSASGASQFTWDNGLGFGNDQVVSPATTTTYIVQGEDANSCINFDTVVVNVLDEMVLTFTAFDANCGLSNGSSLVTVSGGSNDYSYDWSNGSTSALNENLAGGQYTVTVTDNNTGCTATATSSISTTSAPISDFGLIPDVMTLPDHTTSTYNVSSSANDYTWTVTGANYSFASDQEDFDIILPEIAGTYEVCLISYNGASCTDTLCKYIQVRENELLYVPNTFTPDGDEFNNVFKPILTLSDEFGYEFQIFNRWGEVIFESSDIETGWDGTYQGRLVQNGTYIWKIRIKSLHNDEQKDFTGHVNMVK